MKKFLFLLVGGLISTSIFAQKPPAPPPPPPPPQSMEDGEALYKVVENQPLFPGCESETDKKLLNECSKNKFEKFFLDNYEYPAIAKANRIQGVVYVKFVVEKDGTISDPTVVRDIGAGCGEEAVRVVKLMPNWIPGKQRGVPVRVQMTMPVTFRLQ
ncbi:MAG: TonB family protein [Bacteroidetes bacterium]|nr:TonB family protein [Bacteroidota bacterium]